MDFTLIHPLFIFAASLIFVVVWSKTLFLTIPLFIFSLWLCYPGSTFLQIPLAILWVLLVNGNSRAQAYSHTGVKTPKAFKTLLGVIGFGVAGTFFCIRYPEEQLRSFKDTIDLIGSSVGLGIISVAFAYFIILYVICPLIVQEKEKVHTTVRDYYKIYGRRYGGSYVQFAGDAASYKIPFFMFRRFRNKLGIPAILKIQMCVWRLLYW